jgi:hypothetical protein
VNSQPLLFALIGYGRRGNTNELLWALLLEIVGMDRQGAFLVYEAWEGTMASVIVTQPISPALVLIEGWGSVDVPIARQVQLFTGLLQGVVCCAERRGYRVRYVEGIVGGVADADDAFSA